MNKLDRKIPAFSGFSIEIDERYFMAQTKKLFRLGIKLNTPNICNWSCPYCYVGDEKSKLRPQKLDDQGNVTHDLSKDPFWFERMKGWILQGIELGAKAVTLNGTFEPTTSKDLYNVIDFCRSENLATTLVTNGLLLKDDDIERLYKSGVNVLTKLNVPIADSTDPNYDRFCDIQKELSGLKSEKTKIYENQKELIQKFIDIGFNEKQTDGSTRFGVESVITNLNLEFMPKLIRQLRNLNIYAHIEVTKLQGFAKANPNLTISKEKLQWLFETVRDEDYADGFNYYDIKPPYIGGTCYENLHRLDIHADGNVKPCPGIETNIGNLNKISLAEVLNSQSLDIIRNLEKYIEGDCKECDLFKSRECYGGCRGTVYQTLKSNGFSEYESWVGSDPSCWRVENLLDKKIAKTTLFNKTAATVQ